MIPDYVYRPTEMRKSLCVYWVKRCVFNNRLYIITNECQSARNQRQPEDHTYSSSLISILKQKTDNPHLSRIAYMLETNPHSHLNALNRLRLLSTPLVKLIFWCAADVMNLAG